MGVHRIQRYSSLVNAEIIVCSRLEDALSFMWKRSKGMTSGEPYLQEHLIKAALDR